MAVQVELEARCVAQQDGMEDARGLPGRAERGGRRPAQRFERGGRLAQLAAVHEEGDIIHRAERLLIVGNVSEGGALQDKRRDAARPEYFKRISRGTEGKAVARPGLAVEAPQGAEVLGAEAVAAEVAINHGKQPESGGVEAVESTEVSLPALPGASRFLGGKEGGSEEGVVGRVEGSQT